MVLEDIKARDSDYGRIFNGMASITVKKGDQLYDGLGLLCSTYVMSHYISSEGSMPEQVRRSSENGTFKRSYIVERKSDDISGSGDGAILYSQNGVINLKQGSKRYSLALAGNYIPGYMNEGEKISLTHDGLDYEARPKPARPAGYVIDNAVNYGVIYRFDFQGFNTNTGRVKISATSDVRVNFNALVESEGIWITAKVIQDNMVVAEKAYLSKGFSTDNNNLIGEVDATKPVTIYLVMGGGSSLPAELKIEEAN